MKIQTYGKQKLPIRLYIEVKNRFTINPIIRNNLESKGLGVFVPKLNKPRFVTGIIIALIFIILPVVTPLAIPSVLWAIK